MSLAGPSRVDEITGREGYNQNLPFLAADLITCVDLNSVNNRRSRDDILLDGPAGKDLPDIHDASSRGKGAQTRGPVTVNPPRISGGNRRFLPNSSCDGRHGFFEFFNSPNITKIRAFVKKYGHFIGPGFMVAVSYIDPGNYSTDVSAGAQFRFAHLFVVFLSNVLAIFLQSLCVKVGSVTGVDLATNCREHLPKWINIPLYVLAECAIIATDLAEVIGTAIALNILIKLPLVAGVALTMIDVIVILFFYRPNGPLKAFRVFELGITGLVVGVVICLCVELSKIQGTSFDEVMRGYLPSKALVSSEGLYLSCGILGATVMPHSLYLGSGIVQPRIREYDIRKGYRTAEVDDHGDMKPFQPSLAAIRHTMGFCIADLTISLMTCALFVNSSILIVSGATLSSTPGAGSADLWSIHDLLSKGVSKAAGTVFALALLLSGQSAGIVVTISGQMVCEGHFKWSVRPWLRRLTTRAIAIAPCIAVAASLGRDGIGAALNASQVALSILLPFLSAPVIYFTCSKKHMSVPIRDLGINTTTDTARDRSSGTVPMHDFSNNWATGTAAVVIWLFITALNIYLIVSLAMGQDS